MALKNITITREAASADQEAADEFPDTTEKIVEDKEYLAKQVFNAEQIIAPYNKAFPYKSPYIKLALFEGNNRRVVRLTITNHHFCIDTSFFKSD